MNMLEFIHGFKCPKCAAGGADCPYGTPAYGPWIAHHPLGCCDLCRTPTWNPVTWYSRLALAAGERVEEAAGLAP
jgi:hypothetical protein